MLNIPRMFTIQAISSDVINEFDRARFDDASSRFNEQLGGIEAPVAESVDVNLLAVLAIDPPNYMGRRIIWLADGKGYWVSADVADKVKKELELLRDYAINYNDLFLAALKAIGSELKPPTLRIDNFKLGNE